jgi:threonyl-tRNA synthetase
MNHDVAPGMPFFLPHGMTLLLELTKFVRRHSYGEGYNEVRTPQILNSDIWKTSGHWDHYQEDMFCLHHVEDNIDMGIKPMNCPAHMLVFKNELRSYRDLPLRLAEVTTLYRNEKSGTLHGLTRVRSLSQDDCHIFARPEQILEEISKLLDKVKNIYTIFGLKIDEIHLSTRPEKFLGEKSTWDEAEADLKKALENAELEYKINEGDGAFYGPKIDVKVKDAIGRQWQLATVQLDFQLPQRFELKYTDADGTPKTPVVIHRALLGSMERFLGVIIEHYAGVFPIWLSPVQVKLVSVSENHIEACQKLAEEFKNHNIRVEVDESNETVGNKIRKATNEKVPYMLVIGDKEAGAGSLSVRDRGQREAREISKEEFFKELAEKIAKYE